MPSGNAIYTYTGKESSITIQGQIFLKDQPRHITDNGVIDVLEGRKDFELSGRSNIVRVIAAEDIDEHDAVCFDDAGRVRKAVAAKPKGKAK